MFSRSLICSIKRRGPANWRLHTVRPRASVDWIPVGFAVATWAQPCRFDAGRGQSFREGPKTRSGHNFLLQNGRTCGGCPILLLICLDNNKQQQLSNFVEELGVPAVPARQVVLPIARSDSYHACWNPNFHCKGHQHSKHGQRDQVQSETNKVDELDLQPTQPRPQRKREREREGGERSRSEINVFRKQC